MIIKNDQFGWKRHQKTTWRENINQNHWHERSVISFRLYAIWALKDITTSVLDYCFQWKLTCTFTSTKARQYPSKPWVNNHRRKGFKKKSIIMKDDYLPVAIISVVSITATMFASPTITTSGLCYKLNQHLLNWGELWHTVRCNGELTHLDMQHASKISTDSWKSV